MADGWTTGPPDFVGVGAQRCGTTRWFELIAAHPQVHAPTKELHFFDGLWAVDGDLSAYRLARPAGVLAGEWTPRYMFDFWVPALLARAAPDARLLVSLRDPVERWISGMGLARRRGHVEDPALWAPGLHFERGFYARQLRRLFSFFDPAQVLVLQFERCVADPLGELARTYAFLGLEPSFRPDTSAAPDPDGPGPWPPDAVRRELVRAYAADVAELTSLVPGLDPGLWPNFA